MKIKLPKIEIEDIFLMLYLSYIVKFFYLFSVPDAYPSSQRLAGLIAIISFVWLAFYYKKVNGSFRLIVGALCTMIIIQIITSLLRLNSQSIKITVLEGAYYFVVLIYFILVNAFQKKNGFEKFCFLLTAISIILSLRLSVSAVKYNSTGQMTLVLDPLVKMYMRNGNIRIQNLAEGLTRISVLISMGCITEKKIRQKKLIGMHSINILLGLFVIYYLDQSRVYILCILISLVAMFLLSDVTSKAKKWFLIITVIILAGILYNAVIDDVVDSLLMTLSDSSDGSNWKRFAAIQYFIEIALRHPLLGNGLLSRQVGTLSLRYAYNDVGIFGQLGKLGVPIVIWYVVLIFKMSKMLRFKKQWSSANTGLFVCMLISSITLLYIDHNRIICLPVMMAFMEHVQNIYESEGQKHAEQKRKKKLYL